MECGSCLCCLTDCIFSHSGWSEPHSPPNPLKHSRGAEKAQICAHKEKKNHLDKHVKYIHTQTSDKSCATSLLTLEIIFLNLAHSYYTSHTASVVNNHWRKIILLRCNSFTASPPFSKPLFVQTYVSK